MKTLLVAVNSKYSHTSLSVRTLSANAGDVEFCEFTINEDVNFSASEIYEKKPDVLCFSCYIWNIEYVLKLASTLKKMLLGSLIVLGGPEVSFSSVELLENNSFADCIIRGEGEEIFKELVNNNFDFSNTHGVTYRSDKIIYNPDRLPVENLDSLVFPYTDKDLEQNKNKLIYYESSRGCPYNCSYCLSSTVHGVRFKSLEKVKDELLRIIKAEADTVKFVDRTFNADDLRAVEIVKFLKNNGKGTTFHFEIEAHRMSAEFLDAIADAPDGMFRLEIGLQSTNPATLRAINRNDKCVNLFENVNKIIANGNVHVHLDLIAGLPLETYSSFMNSFDEALSLKPDVLQLGFLKLLKGTSIREQSLEHDYVYRDYPPYEVITNRYISCSELIELKRIEILTDKFYNSGGFILSVEFMREFYGKYSLFFEKLNEYFKANNLYYIQHSKAGLYKIFADFARCAGVKDVFFDVLKFDYFTSNVNASTPEWSLQPYNSEIHNRRKEIIEANKETLFADFGNLPSREILKSVHFEIFNYRVQTDMAPHDSVAVFTKQGKLLGFIK